MYRNKSPAAWLMLESKFKKLSKRIYVNRYTCGALKIQFSKDSKKFCVNLVFYLVRLNEVPFFESQKITFDSNEPQMTQIVSRTKSYENQIRLFWHNSRT